MDSGYLIRRHWQLLQPRFSRHITRWRGKRSDWGIQYNNQGWISESLNSANSAHSLATHKEIQVCKSGDEQCHPLITIVVQRFSKVPPVMISSDIVRGRWALVGVGVVCLIVKVPPVLSLLYNSHLLSCTK